MEKKKYGNKLQYIKLLIRAQNRIFVLLKARIGLCVFTRRHKCTKSTRYHFELLDVKAFYVVGMSDPESLYGFFFFLQDWQTLFKLHKKIYYKRPKMEQWSLLPQHQI